jgi:ribosome-associated toxin RatA of RatAB toxin-antitoxin module
MMILHTRYVRNSGIFFHVKAISGMYGIIAVFIDLVCSPVNAEFLKFPDSSGKVVARTPEYAIRLIETPGSSVKTAEAVFIINASPGRCYQVISDFKHYPEFMPNIVSVEYAGMHDSLPLYRFGFRVAVFTVNYTNIFRCGTDSCEGYDINWGFVCGDIKNSTGFWHIRPYGKDACSYIHYSACIDAGKLVPGWIRDRLTLHSLPSMITAVEKRVR